MIDQDRRPKSEFPEHLPICLRDLKNEMLKKTQKTLAKISGLHLNTVSRWENGYLSQARFSDLVKMADSLGYEFLLFPKE